MTEQEKKFITDNAGLVFVGLLELVGNNNQYCPVLGGACKYVLDGKCTAAECIRVYGLGVDCEYRIISVEEV